MSRSYRQTMVYGHGGGSEKQDKRLYNRALRSRTRQTLHTCDDFEAVILPVVLDVSNVWSMAKDGKSYCTWLAGYRNTLAKVRRTRDGRKRYLLAITERTLEHHDADTRRRRYRWGIDWLSEERAARSARMFDINNSLDLIRK